MKSPDGCQERKDAQGSCLIVNENVVCWLFVSLFLCITQPLKVGLNHFSSTAGKFSEQREVKKESKPPGDPYLSSPEVSHEEAKVRQRARSASYIPLMIPLSTQVFSSPFRTCSEGPFIPFCSTNQGSALNVHSIHY